jgi:adenine-specific DNA-methyltransferase
MSLFVDPLVPDWEPIPVIWEVAVKEAGFGLNSTIEKTETTEAKKLYHVADAEREQWFHICLDEQITLDMLKPLNLSKDDLFICRDSALDDTAAANLALQCRLRTI